MNGKALVALTVLAVSLARFACGDEVRRVAWSDAQRVAASLGSELKDGASVPASTKGSPVFIQEYTYQASETDSLASAREKALEGAEQLALKQIGTAIISDFESVQSENNGADFTSVKDHLISLAGGVTSGRELSGEWDVHTLKYHITAEVHADPDQVRATLRTIVAQWSRNRAEVLKKLAAVEGIPAPAQGAIFSNDNFKKCVEIYSQGLSDGQREKCISPWGNYYERGCLAKLPQPMSAVDAAGRCLELARSFPFLNHPNFDKCLSIYGQSWSIISATAANKCVEKIARRKFSFVGNPEFDSCVEIYHRSISDIAEAADACVKEIQRATR